MNPALPVGSSKHTVEPPGRLAVRKEQHQEGSSWVAARQTLRRRHGGGGTGSGSASGSTSTGGYYLSSYPSASTIYCADDSEWRGLSKTYLRHHATYAPAQPGLPELPPASTVLSNLEVDGLSDRLIEAPTCLALP